MVSPAVSLIRSLGAKERVEVHNLSPITPERMHHDSMSLSKPKSCHAAYADALLQPMTPNSMNRSLELNTVRLDRCGKHIGPLQHQLHAVSIKLARNHPHRPRIPRGLARHLCQLPRIRP